MLQDYTRGLSKWLSEKPDALQHVKTLEVQAACYVNGDEFDNMLDDRVAIIQTSMSSYRRTPLYKTAPITQPAHGWQPITTAPKDGTEVILYGIWAGEINGKSIVSSIDIGYWSTGKSDFAGDEWWLLSTGDAYSCWMEATHWMPVPGAPA